MFKTIAATVVAATVTFGGAAVAQAETPVAPLRGEVATQVVVPSHKVVNRPSMLNEEQGYDRFETAAASKPVVKKVTVKKVVKKTSHKKVTKKVVKRHHKVTRRVVRRHHH